MRTNFDSGRHTYDVFDSRLYIIQSCYLLHSFTGFADLNDFAFPTQTV